MKAIIKGRGYVTDNAELLGEVTLNGARTGLKWWSAGLYRIPRAGCYFLAGEGNFMTGWRRRVDSGGWAEGQGIVPMNLKEARECLTTAQVEAAAFGDQAIVTGDGSRDVGPGSSPWRVRRRASSRCAAPKHAGDPDQQTCADEPSNQVADPSA